MTGLLPRYKEITEDLDKLIANGYKSNQDQILALMSGLAEDNLALNQYFKHALHNKNIRKLAGSQSFTLYSSPSYFMRINLWFPQQTKLPSHVREPYYRYFSNGMCHNHNFDFFTIGLLGPGYRSDFFSTSPDIEASAVGDDVEVQDHWSIRLKLNECLFVPKITHFHSQHPPEAFSVSLNIIPFSGYSESGRQFIVNQSTLKIEHLIIDEGRK